MGIFENLGDEEKLTDEESKKNLNELYEKMGLNKKEVAATADNQIINEQTKTNPNQEFSRKEKSRQDVNLKMSSEEIAAASRRQHDTWLKSLMRKPTQWTQEQVEKKSEGFIELQDIPKAAPSRSLLNLFKKNRNIIRRGEGQRFKKSTGRIQKQRYSASGKPLGITAKYKTALREAGIDWDSLSKTERRKVMSEFEVRFDESSGKWKYRKSTPSRIKSAFSKFKKELEPKGMTQSQWMAQKQEFYNKQRALLGSDFNPHNHPFLESELLNVKNKNDYLKSLQNSQYAYMLSKQQLAEKKLLARRIIQQQTENLKSSQTLAADSMFSPAALAENKAIDLFQNQFSDPENLNNIMVKKENSIDLLNYSKSHPNILTPQDSHILDGKNNLHFF